MQSNERKTDSSLSTFYTLINIEKIKLTFMKVWITLTSVT